MTGTALRPLPSRLTTWKRWKKLFPHTLVLSPKTGYARDYESDPYAGYKKSPFAFFRTKKSPPFLQEKELVLGLEIDGKFKAYPFSLLKKLKTPIEDILSGKSVRIYFERESEEAYATTAAGEPLAAIISYWFVWYSFHKETAVFKRP